MERIEALGYILKKETLATLKFKESLPALVLEDMAPFSGYYDMFNLPRNRRELIPRSVFVVIRSFYEPNEDEFIRITQKIKKEHPALHFDAILGQLTVMNERAFCIRLKMDELDELAVLIRHYASAGLVFARPRQIKEFATLIKVRKYFVMNVLDEGIFQDNDQANSYYLEVAREPEWADFEMIYENIRNNYDFKHFVAAIGSMYRKPGLVDFIRIYSEEIQLEQLKYLRDRFRSELRRVVPE
jgi:hypothetical protein